MKKKILFLLHLPPPIHGAAVMGEVIRNSEYINASFQTKYVNLSTSQFLNRIGKISITKIISHLLVTVRFYDSIIRFNPDSIYVTLTSKGMGFYKDVLVIFLPKLLGYDFVYHFHNKGVSERQDNIFDNLLYKFVFRKAKIFLLSERLYSDIEKYVPRSRVEICPNGLDLKQVSSMSSMNKKDSFPTLLFISNLITSKGIWDFIEAVEILVKKGYQFKALIVGAESEITRSQLERTIEQKQIGSTVEYLGKIYGKDKFAVLARSDIFVFPSYYHNETFGLVLLEAMNFGLACVSTNEGGIQDLVLDNQTGFIVEKRNPVKLSEAIEKLIVNETLCKDMGKKGRRHAETEFSIENFEGRFVTALRSVV